MIFLLLNSLSWAAKPCGTLDHLRQLEPNALQLQPQDTDELQRSNKEEREGLASLPNSRSSDNFIVKWNGNVDSAAIDRLLAAFELSWAIEVDDLGHPAPAGTNQYLFNVYIGDSGGNAPTAGGAAGYFTFDNAYYPMIVVAKGTLENPEYADITAAHEFYHAIQAKAERYGYDESSPGAWFWESTATWASAEVYPENLYYSSFLFSYAFLPNHPVDYFNYPDTGSLDEFYQYGSFIFPLDISQQLGGELIREAWLDNGGDPDPVEVLRSIMASDGVDFDAFWMDHSARMSQFDFPYGDLYAEYVNGYASYYSESQSVIAARHSGEGTGGWVDIPSSNTPFRYGYTQIEFTNPSESAYQIVIEGENVSNLGQIAFYDARAVVDSAGVLTYYDIVADGEANYIGGLSAADKITLVVGAWSSDWSPGTTESFPFSYAIMPEDWEDPNAEPAGEPAGEPSTEIGENDDSGDTLDESPKSGCACQTEASPSKAWVGLLLPLVIWTRRRGDNEHLSVRS